ncbi:hypothetical protein PHYC_02936 [Phycisphaerales bacterium]|nr:hypothetical protein PHYC_02936 [Phycisphaerales bacterium]
MLDLFLSGNAAWFGVPALLGTGVFAIRLLMAIFGHIGHADFDSGHSDLGHAEDSSAVFKFLSFQSVAAFLMGFGWAGLGALHGAHWSMAPAFAAAVGGGALMMWFIIMLFKALVSLNASGNVNIDQTVGCEGEVYVGIPGNQSGRGQVRVVIEDRQRTYGAVSAGQPIPSRTRVRVVRANTDNTLTVEPT